MITCFYVLKNKPYKKNSVFNAESWPLYLIKITHKFHESYKANEKQTLQYNTINIKQ